MHALCPSISISLFGSSLPFTIFCSLLHRLLCRFDHSLQNRLVLISAAFKCCIYTGHGKSPRNLTNLLVGRIAVYGTKAFDFKAKLCQRTNAERCTGSLFLFIIHRHFCVAKTKAKRGNTHLLRETVGEGANKP